MLQIQIHASNLDYFGSFWKKTAKLFERERKRERETHTHRQTDRQTETEREKEKEIQKERGDRQQITTS